MSQTSALLGLPYLDAAQAQKHVTHNEALRRLDAIVQLAVLDRDLATPPIGPQEGERYIVAAGASGAWAGRVGQVAAWQDGAWAFFAPAPGWLAWVSDEEVLLAYVSGGWITTGGGGGGSESSPLFGVNTIADAVNRLAVKSDAVLLSHDNVTPGSGNMRAVMNKASASNTASLLFQNNTSGRAEVGLTGDDKLHLKVSSNGSTWVDAVTIEPTGAVSIAASASEGTAAIRVDGQSGGASAVNISRWSNDNGGVLFNAVKSRGASPGSYTAVQSGDLMGAYAFYASTGSTVVVSGYLRSIVSGTVSGGSVPSELNFFTTPIGGSLTPRLILSNAGNLVPATDNTYTCGQNGLRWSSVWAANGTIQTSDARDKDVIGGLDFAGTMVDAVDPVLFRWKVGGNDVRSSETGTMILDDLNEVPAIEVVPKPGVRAHSGFIAQDIKAAMDAAGVDFGVWGLEQVDDPDSRQFMRPDQLIAVLWAALKETRAEVKRLRDIPEL